MINIFIWPLDFVKFDTNDFKILKCFKILFSKRFPLIYCLPSLTHSRSCISDEEIQQMLSYKMLF